MNKVILVGRVGQDPVIRYTQQNTAIASFSIATSTKSKGQEKTEWHKITAWDKLANIVENYVKKGTLVLIEGSISYKEWEKDGNKNYSAEITAYNLQMLGGKTDNKEEKQEQPPSNKKPTSQELETMMDDLPF